MSNAPVRIDPHRLTTTALDGLIEEFATRDGTDYGATEVPLAAKSAALRAMLARGEIAIMFDPEHETITLVNAETASVGCDDDAETSEIA